MIPYDATAHRFWAVRELDGRISYETSPDGNTFTPFADAQTPIDVSHIRFMLYSGTSSAVAAPGEAKFASAGQPSATPSAACPAAMLVDRFDDGVIGPEWALSYTDSCCTQTETGGVVTFATDGTATGNAARRSASGSDLRDDEFVVTLTTPPTGPSVTASLTARRDAANFLSLRVTTTATVARVVVDGVQSDTTATRAPSEVYLRIRESGGNIYFDVSADKASWRNLDAVRAPFVVDDVLVDLGIGVRAMTAPDQISFDDFNVP
jgi:beta-xylosidase